MSILHLLAAYGLCFGLMNDKVGPVSHWLRALPGRWGPLFQRMLDCSFCTGFHCGWLVYLVSGRADGLGGLVLWALSASAFCYAMDAWVRWLECRSDPPSGS